MFSELEPFQKSRLQSSDDFPGWTKATQLLESLIISAECRGVVDIGGGANPMLSSQFVQSRGLQYGLIDISREELDKAPAHYTRRVCIDVAAPTEEFRAAVGGGHFDLAFSHMFLEHVRDAYQVHSNIAKLLPSGGLAVHMYPSANNLPLALNRVLPEGFSTRLLKFAHPTRDIDGKQGKFPAYYRMCGNSSPKLNATFTELGYRVLVHCGFVGHNYYKRIPLVNGIANALVGPLVRMGIGLTSFQLLVLRKV